MRCDGGSARHHDSSLDTGSTHSFEQPIFNKVTIEQPYQQTCWIRIMPKDGSYKPSKVCTAKFVTRVISSPRNGSARVPAVVVFCFRSDTEESSVKVEFLTLNCPSCRCNRKVLPREARRSSVASCCSRRNTVPRSRKKTPTLPLDRSVKSLAKCGVPWTTRRSKPTRNARSKGLYGENLETKVKRKRACEVGCMCLLTP